MSCSPGSARGRSRAALGFDITEQTRISTAVSEIARNAFSYAGGGRVLFTIEGKQAPQVLTIAVSDKGPGIARLDEVMSGSYRSETGMGLGIVGARRLMDYFAVDSTASGTTITLKKLLSAKRPALTAGDQARLQAALMAERPDGLIGEVQRQNQELLRTLDDLNARQEELVRLNRELEDTNRGVVALYAELDERADHLRRADEIKTRFLSNMTHEFRTPVNSILALTNLLAERLDARPEREGRAVLHPQVGAAAVGSRRRPARSRQGRSRQDRGPASVVRDRRPVRRAARHAAAAARQSVARARVRGTGRDSADLLG